MAKQKQAVTPKQATPVAAPVQEQVYTFIVTAGVHRVPEGTVVEGVAVDGPCNVRRGQKFCSSKELDKLFPEKLVRMGSAPVVTPYVQPKAADNDNDVDPNRPAYEEMDIAALRQVAVDAGAQVTPDMDKAAVIAAIEVATAAG